jgi:membrane associated rhomboid family serine protease
VNDNRNTSSGGSWGWLGALFLFFFHVIFAIIVLLVLCWVAVAFVLLVKKLLNGLGEYMLSGKIKRLGSPNR